MWRKFWPIWVVVLSQLLILVAIPWQKIQARISGKQVILQTRPVDPYDIMSGYYVTLSYEVERTELKPPEGGNDGLVFLVLQKNAEGRPWTPVEIRLEPGELSTNQAALMAFREGGYLDFPGIKKLFLSEKQSKEVERLMEEAEGKALVYLWVDATGNAAVQKLMVGGREFGE